MARAYWHLRDAIIWVHDRHDQRVNEPWFVPSPVAAILMYEHDGSWHKAIRLVLNALRDESLSASRLAKDGAETPIAAGFWNNFHAGAVNWHERDIVVRAAAVTELFPSPAPTRLRELPEQLPPPDPFVTLSEAVSWVAFRHAMDSGPVGGEPEFIAADGHGKVYVNVSGKNEIAVINVASKSVTAHLALPGCNDPGGLAINRQAGVLVSACANGIAVVMNLDGSNARTVPIGKGPDGVTFDQRGQRFLIPCGTDGVIAVINESVAGSAGVQLVRAIKGGRTGVLDAESGLFYVPTAVSLPAVGGARPGHMPGTFRILGLRVPVQ